MKKALIGVMALLLSSCDGLYPVPESAFTQRYEESLEKPFSRFEDFSYSLWRTKRENDREECLCYYNGKESKWKPGDYGIKDHIKLINLFLSEAGDQAFEALGSREILSKTPDGIGYSFFFPFGADTVKNEDRYALIAKSPDSDEAVWSICCEKNCVTIAFGQGKSDEFSYSHVNLYAREGESAAYQRIATFYEDVVPVDGWMGIS